MIDIMEFSIDDLALYNSEVQRAANILSVQLGSLEYAKTIGIDLDFFLSDNFRFENESFKNYCVQVLANQGINVAKVTEAIENLSNSLTFNLKPGEQTDGFVAR